MQFYISHRHGRIFNPLIFFFVIVLLYWFVTKNIGNYRKYVIFFNFRFTENIFPSKTENHENMIFMFSIFTKMLFFMQCFINKAKNSGKVFCFLDNCIWIDCFKISLLRKEYLWSAVNMLTNSTKISDINNRNIFELYFPPSNEKNWSNCCPADFSRVWDPCACWLPKDVAKRGFLGIYPTTSFAVRNSKIKQLWGSWLFSKCSKFDLDFRNKAKKIEKVFLRNITLLNWLLKILRITKRILVISSQYINKQR